MQNFAEIPTGLSNFQVSDTDDLLNRIGESLQLDATRKAMAEQRYKTVAGFIEKDPFFANALISVYPQGSFRIRTTVKPYKQKEFDLDFVVHLDFITWNNHQPLKVLNELERCLRGTGYYEGKLSRKNRCVRITYENDFHLDITVGCQESYLDEEKIQVPDRKTKSWTPSNPKGYASWFTARGHLTKERYELYKRAHDARNPYIRLSENLPSEPAYELKLPLERAVQIIKRYRDIYFDADQDLATSSIILTTLAASSYQGQLSVYETIDGFITDIESRARTGFIGLASPFQVLNPANPKENFSEKWFEDRRLFTAFMGFIKNLRSTWQQLKESSKVSGTQDILKRAFGNDRVMRLIGEQATYTQKVKQYRDLMPLAQMAGTGTLFTTPAAKATTDRTSVQNTYARRHGGENYKIGERSYSLGTCILQQRWLDQHYPSVFKTRIVKGMLVSTGKIRPTPDCDEYLIQITYVPGYSPEVRILSHDIKPRKCIHIYSDGSLCLYFPGDLKWKLRTSIAANTIPWTIEWIICYELWKLSGKWEGLEKH